MIGFILILAFFGKVYNLNDASCGQISYTYTSGSIISSIYGDCEYKIDVSAQSRWVLLEWTEFTFDATMPNCNDGDFVEVFTGCSKKTSISRFCTRNMKQLPHAIFAFDGCIYIQVKPINQRYSSKFQAKYQSFLKSDKIPEKFYSSCNSGNIYSQVGVVSSPHWPLSYNSYIFSLWNCEWDIETLYTNKVIKLNFMDMDLYTNYCGLKVKGKKSLQTTSKYELSFCARDQPFSLTTKYYSLEIDLETSYLSKGIRRGFVVGFVAYDEAISVTAVTWKFIVGGVFALLFFIVFIAICCFRAYKRRQTVTQVQYSSAQYGTVQPGSSDSYPKVQLGYPQQAGYPQQQPPGYPQQQGGYPQQPFSGYPQQAAYPTPVEYPVKQGYPVDFAQYPPPTQQNSANANVPPPPYPGVQQPPYPATQQPYPGAQQPAYPGAQQTHSYIPQ